MRFNSVAMLIGWAATLGAAVPLDSSATHNFIRPAIEHAELAAVAGVTFNNDQAIKLKNMFPAAVEECLTQNHNLTWSNGPVHYNANQNHTGYILEGRTIDQICNQSGSPMMSASNPFRNFEKFVYGKKPQCQDVDMEPLEHFFWKVNHRCHKIWTRPQGQQLGPGAEAEIMEADFAAEADWAEEEDAVAGLTSMARTNFVGDRQRITSSMFPIFVQACLEKPMSSNRRYGPSGNRPYKLTDMTIRQICGRKPKKARRAGKSSFARFERFTYDKINQCRDIDMEPLEQFFWKVNYRCHDIWFKKNKGRHASLGAMANSADAAVEEADVAVEDAQFEADLAAEGADTDDSYMSDDE